MLFDNLFAARSTSPAQIPENRWFSWFKPPAAGVHVDEKKANSFAPVFACTRVISETLMLFPFRVYRRDGNARIHQPAHPVDIMLNSRPNDEVSAGPFRQAKTAHALLWGNGYAEIDRSRSGKVGAMHCITPDCVEINRDGNGRLIYETSQGSGSNRVLGAQSMYHLRGPSFDGVAGYSIVGLARESISAGMAAEEFAASFWGNGAVPTGFIQQAVAPGVSGLSPDGATSLLKSLEKRLKGSSRAFKLGYLDAGMEYNPVGVPPGDAQFLESRRYNVTDICRWFRVPPHKVADLDRATFTNIEEQEKAFVNDAIMPWVIRMEQEANLKLLTPQELAQGFFCSMNVKALLRGDSRARSEYYRNLWGVGALSTNDILQKEDENPIGKEGDERFIPMNHMSLRLAASQGDSGKSTQGDHGANYEPLAAAAAERVTRKFAKAWERKADKPGFEEWLASFDLEADLRESFGPMFETAGADLGDIAAFVVRSGHELKTVVANRRTDIRAITLEATTYLKSKALEVCRVP